LQPVPKKRERGVIKEVDNLVEKKNNMRDSPSGDGESVGHFQGGWGRSQKKFAEQIHSRPPRGPRTNEERELNITRPKGEKSCEDQQKVR